jgi:hypothetical protein
MWLPAMRKRRSIPKLALRRAASQFGGDGFLRRITHPCASREWLLWMSVFQQRMSRIRDTARAWNCMSAKDT